MNIALIIVALLGATLAFGPELTEMILVGLANLDFISAESLIVFGIVLLIPMAMSIAWALGFRESTSKKVVIYRGMTWVVMALVVLVYTILVSSFWADQWLVLYQDWLLKKQDWLQTLTYIGWFAMVGPAGWGARVIYDCLCVPSESPGSHKKSSGGK